MQQRTACADGVRERDEVLVELAGGDRVKEQRSGALGDRSLTSAQRAA